MESIITRLYPNWQTKMTSEDIHIKQTGIMFHSPETIMTADREFITEVLTLSESKFLAIFAM